MSKLNSSDTTTWPWYFDEFGKLPYFFHNIIKYRNYNNCT